VTDSSTPLAPRVLGILFALADGEKHGYAIMKEIRTGPATLYTSLQKLIDIGWIEETGSPRDADSRRRYYRLTKAGTITLQTELKRMEALVRKSKSMRLLFPEVSS
jgi:DNA-binding PadR family transcriptional regulator